ARNPLDLPPRKGGQDAVPGTGAVAQHCRTPVVQGAEGMKSQRITRFSLCLAMACGAAVAGCHSPLFRGQSPDVEQVVAEESGTPLVGELTFASGMTPVEVHGVGLVTGLNKTGSDPRADGYREQLIDEMQTHDVDNPQTILAS